MMGPVAKFVRLDRGDRALLLAAARLLAKTWIGLRTAGFNVIRERAARLPSPGSRSWSASVQSLQEPAHRPSVERIGWAVRAAGRFVPGASNCLVRALATQTLLGRFGYRSDLRIGVRKAGDGGIAAHAWLECDGAVVVGDFELDHYIPLAPAGRPDSAPQL